MEKIGNQLKEFMEYEWVLKEDGYLNVDCKSQKIIYHPNLNVILIFDDNFLKVLDVNSGVLLQSCLLSGKSKITFHMAYFVFLVDSTIVIINFNYITDKRNL